MFSFWCCWLWNSKYYDQKEISHYSPFMQTNYFYIILFRVSLFYLVLRKYVILPNLNWKILFVYEHVWSCLLGFIVEVKIIEKFYYLTWKMNFYSCMTVVLKIYSTILSKYCFILPLKILPLKKALLFILLLKYLVPFFKSIILFVYSRYIEYSTLTMIITQKPALFVVEITLKSGIQI